MSKRLSHFDELEAIKLLSQCEKGDRKYRRTLNRLVTYNLGLVHKIVHKFPMKNATCSYDDLFQEGVAGLIHGIEKFDPSRGCRLSTYVYNWISAYVRRYYQNNGRNVRIPVHMAEKQMKMNKQIEELTEVLGRTPTLSEIQEVCSNAGTIMASMTDCVSLNCVVGEDSELESMVGEDKTDEFESVVDCEILLSRLKEVVSRRDYEILIKRYGLDGTGARTLSELSEEFDITRARIHQVQNELLSKMRALSV